MNSLSLRMIGILLVTLLTLPLAAWGVLDSEFNKNGEVYVLLGKTEPGFAPRGIYKTSEYSVDSTGKRSVIVATEDDVRSGRVRISKGDGFNRNYTGLAVGRERECYTYVSEVGGWVSAGPDWKVRGMAEWWPDGCTAAHTASHAHTWGAGICAWRSSDRSRILQNYSFKVGGKLTLRGSYDASRDEFTGFSGVTVVFPCSGRYQNWDGSDMPEPIGPWDWATLRNGTRVKKSRSNEYMIPCGMFFHNLESGSKWGIRHKMTNSGRGHCIFMYMGALKPTNLNKQTWLYKGGAKPWTRTVDVGSYERFDHPKVVFRLFEAKYHIYIVTPCGDGCLSSSSAATQGAGNSHINITITPFGRTYGILTVKKANGDLEKVELKRHDPEPKPDGKEYTYSPNNWASANPKLHLKIIKANPRARLSSSDWTDARSIATSYKYDPSEVTGDFSTKQEFVYLSDAPNFAVADTWFGSGGRAYFADAQSGATMTVTSQTRDEEKNKTNNLFFKLRGRIQDIAADGYGNFFYLTTTDIKPIEEMMEANRNDFTKIKTILTSKDKFGYSVAENYTDTDWYSMDGETWRKITFDLVIYKTIYKIGAATVDKEGKPTDGSAVPDLSNPFGAVPPEVVGRIPIGRNSYARFAKKVGAVITFEPIQIMSADDRSDWPAELATLNIAAPPEEQGFNYYVDIKGPGSNVNVTDPAARQKIIDEEKAIYDKFNDRVAKATDFTYEGETPSWSMENAPEFKGIYGLNTNTGNVMTDENGNGIIGSLRNNVIRESMAVRWLVYRLYDVKALGLPPQTVNANAPFPVDPASGGGELKSPQLGDYKYIKLKDVTKIYKGTAGWKRKDGRENSRHYPGAVEVDNPFSNSYHFLEAGIYMVLMQLDFEYYNYSELGFGSNRNNQDDVRKTSAELEASIGSSSPGYYTADPAHPVFLHTRDTRYVVVLARDANSDGVFIKKVSVNMIDGGVLKEGAPLSVLEVEEIDRSALPTALPTDKDNKESSRLAANSNDTIEAQLKSRYVDKQKFVVGDFAIKFVSALPDRETDSGSGDRNLAERFGGIGVWDYSPDLNPSHVETGSSRATLYASGNAQHPPNFAALGRGDLTDLSLATVKPGTTKPFDSDRKMLVKRNYGMHGKGTLVRALNENRIQQLQPTGSNFDPARAEEEKLTIIPVADSFWNDGNGVDYPIREADWDAVHYKWHVAYQLNGKDPKREDNGKYTGTIGEVMRWCRKTGHPFPVPADSFFIERLGKRTLPGVGSGNAAKSLFDVTMGSDLYTVDKAKMPAFHVRFPFLEKLNDGKSNPDGIPDFRPVRWETPIGPGVYHIGLEISAPALEWREDDTYKMRARLMDGTTVENKQVFWDLFPWREKTSQDGVVDGIDTARCGPVDDEKAKDILSANSNFGLGHARVFVKDLEPPRLLYTRRAEETYYYKNGTTGDKYPEDIFFRIVDNNPNSTVDPATFNPQVTMNFPLVSDNSPLDRNLPTRGGLALHSEETYPLTPPASATLVEDGGKCFEFTPTASQEMWGAPYAEMGFRLPAVSGGGEITSEGLTQDKKSLDSTPFMPPSFVGDLYYNVAITMRRVNWQGAVEDQTPFVLRDMWKAELKFQVEDNDPPELFLEVRTSFTDVDLFGLALHHADTTYDFATRFAEPVKYAKDYGDSLQGNNPSTWPHSLVDARGPTPIFGTSHLTIMKAGVADKVDLVSDGNSNNDDTMEASVSRIRSRDPKYLVNIPEQSRAVFAVQVIDNVPDADGNHLLKPDEAGRLSVAVIEHSGGKVTTAMEHLQRDLTANPALDPIKPRTLNYYGNFRTAMKSGENAAAVFTAKDAKGNESRLSVPVFVLDTFIKQDRLDLEKERRD